MEEIRLAVLGVTLQEYPEIRLSVSIGGTYGTGGMPELIRLADQMLYPVSYTHLHRGQCLKPEEYPQYLLALPALDRPHFFRVGERGRGTQYDGCLSVSYTHLLRRAPEDDLL